MAKKFSVADVISKERYEQALQKTKTVCDEWTAWYGNTHYTMRFGAPMGGFNLDKHYVRERKDGGETWINRGNKYIWPHDKSYEHFVREIDAQEWTI